MHTAALFPPVMAGGSQIGALSREAAAALGLTEGIPIYLAPGDAGALTLGAGCGDLGSAYLYIGTSGWLGLSSDQRVDPLQGAFNLAHPRADRVFVIAPLLTAGGNLDWARGVLADDTSLDAMIAHALERPQSDILYLPYLNGERAPFRDSKARAAFVGMNSAHDSADLMRAVLEGVAFAYRHAVDALLSVPPARVSLTGGGARSAAWGQVFADVLNVPVEMTGSAPYVGLIGAVLSAQYARGEISAFPLASSFPIELSLMPNVDRGASLSAKYARFRALYPALKPIFDGA
jgi:xylulokinase